MDVKLIALPAHMSKRSGKAFFNQEGQARWDDAPVFATYRDHRMAMAFSILSFLNPIWIEDPGVVDKSYPGFWKDLEKLGFQID